MMDLGNYLQRVFEKKYKSLYTEKELENSTIISNGAKIKIMSFGSVIIGGASVIFLIARLFYLELFTYQEAHLAFLAVAFLGLFIYLRNTLNVQAGIIVFNALWLINLPLRVFMTGGLMSPLIVGYLGHSIYVYCLIGHSWGKISLFWSLVSIGFFAFIDPFYKYEDVLVTSFPEIQTLLAVLALVFVTLPILFMFDEKKAMEDSIREIQNKAASFVVMKRLNHEIGNSLYKALGYLEILRSKKDPSLVKGITEPLEDIKEVGEALSELAREGDLVDLLKERKDDIKIMTRLREEGL